ncbi:hypothetical protein BJ994_002693 [Arthrobacter pigmenti]|uniref:Uncharacterized protein n=1 Tax=Arthrobacter pigmenti TaxID=271432 RepID=A0A846RTX7_9MICC|nr:hypothetical protein [Arthrobacter pigmenti]
MMNNPTLSVQIIALSSAHNAIICALNSLSQRGAWQ